MKAEFARLNNSLAWCAPSRRNFGSTFIEIDFNQQMNISGIATQGFRGINAYYVKQYKVAYSKERITWKFLEKVSIEASRVCAMHVTHLKLERKLHKQKQWFLA